MLFVFDDCEFDVERRELRRDGRLQPVEPQVLDLLLHLIRHRDRVVGKDELLQVVWGGRIVSESTLTSRVSAARRAIGDTGQRQMLLRTLQRRGFRFCGHVEERSSDAGRAASPPIEPSDVPSDRYAAAPPASATTLVGRDADVAQIGDLLDQARLVTLTGVGGVGKTRLALAVARQLSALHPDGVAFVELADVREPAATARAVAGALGVVQQAGVSMEQSLAIVLASRRSLLVLDNCEHLIDAVAALVRDLLAHCPELTILATSRETLAVDGEQVRPISPLAFVGPTSPAVELFMLRARTAAVDLDLAQDGDAVSEICRRVDGIPLAIELAAGRLRAMSAAQIRDRLDGGFGLTSGGGRGEAPRHETLRRTIQWSYDLLSDSERLVLIRASAFAGGFTLDAAERLCSGGPVEGGDVLDLVDSLVRKSLITVERSGGDIRYGVLETIRQFGHEQLAAAQEGRALAERHAQMFAAASDANFRVWRSSKQATAYAWLDREFANLRAAFRWAIDHANIDIAARIASNVGDMARFRVRDEAALWAGEIVDDARSVRHPRLAVLLTWAASTAWGLGQFDDAKALAREAVGLIGEPGIDPFVWAFTDLAMVAAYEGDVRLAIDVAREGAAEPADADDRFCLARSPYFLVLGGCEAEARQIADDVIATVEAAGVPSSICVCLWATGRAFVDTDPLRALAAFERAIALASASANRLWEGMASLDFTALQARRGDPAAALDSFGAMLCHWCRSADLVFVSHGLGTVVVLLDRLGHAEAAATLSGALSKLFRSTSFVADLADAVKRAERAMGKAAFARASRDGGSMSLGDVYDFAMRAVDRARSKLTPS